MHIIINKRNQRVERLDADPREALGQHVGAQRHRRAHRADRQRIADACGVAPKKVQLQRFERAARDLDVGERSKSGVDAVGRLVAARAPQIGISASSVSMLIPEKPLASTLARSAIVARTARTGSGSPTPAAWLRRRFSCSVSSAPRAILTSANDPNPVLMP